jgi:hypothetical protein
MALAVTKRTLSVYLNVLLCVFVMCAGADLIFLALPRLQELQAGRYEERVLFDVGFAALTVLCLAARAGWSLLSGLRARTPAAVTVTD